MKGQRLIIGSLLFSACFILPQLVRAQSAHAKNSTENLPTAPQPQSAPNATVTETPRAMLSATFPPQAVAQSAQAAPNVPPPSGTLRLSRSDAEQLAIRNNPRISVGKLLALAQHQVYRESRAAELPNFNGAITAVDANEGSRITAGYLTASRVLEHAGAGVTLSQLITDFGRTINLVSSAKLQEKAQQANAQATQEDIVLATDEAFYNALQAQALLKVAQQTVTTRQSAENQINELARNKLKSDLDLSFAQVNLSQAKLLQLDAENNVNSTIAALTAVLGFDKEMQYELTEDDTQALPPPPPDVDVLISTAIQQRPDLQALTFGQQAAQKFYRAQRDQLRPTISALGITGVSPVRPDCFGYGCSPNYFISSWYGAVGVNVSVPIFNGFLFVSEASEANLRAKAAAENTRDLRDRVVRDVRTAWLAAHTAFQKVSVTAEMAKEADLALNLAQGRYNLGLGSIVELSQAQLQQTDAAVGYVNAQYQYRLALSTLKFEIGALP
ncbi:MAG: TolC family protein [Candidatus Sulfotelmatobacter sp.]